MDFTNKVALVTGASRGIGREICLELASHNCNVVINYNNSKEEAFNLEKEIKDRYNVDVLTVKGDVSNENDVKEMISIIIEKFNKIDILINNAGIAIDTLFENKKVSDFKRILDVNLIGPFIVSREVSKYMTKGSKIINIASTNGIDTNYPYSLDYDASKAGLISLTHNLAELFKPNINVNAVAPGWIDTDMNKNLDIDYRNEEISKIKLGRFGKPNEIAKVVVFLASDDANYINDAVIRVDGGEKA